MFDEWERAEDELDYQAALKEWRERQMWRVDTESNERTRRLFRKREEDELEW